MKLRVTLALFALLSLTGNVARAQMSEGERKAAARAAYMEGVSLQDKGNPAEALARFEAAQKLFDAPTHLLHIAECQALTGKLVEASETYETLARKPLGKDAPDAFVQAQEQGKAELQQLRPRIPTMRITVKPEPQSLQNLQISVNDKQMPTELVGIARPVNPGTYRLTATATGWATATPVDADLKEKEQKSVELALQQGAASAVVVVGPTPAQETSVPPPYEQQPRPKAKEGPSASGLLLGIRPGVFVPAGDIEKGRSFGKYATSGPGVGIDVIGRVARLFLVGGTLEIASLGAPSANTLPSGVHAEISTTSVYAGVLAGIMPNVDRVSFVADAGFGARFLSQSRKLTAGTAMGANDDAYHGLEIAINAGLSIPAGPIRIVPKAGLAFGQFSDRSCGVTSISGVSTFPGCESSSTLNSASHTMLQLALGLYYHLDFAKKSASASASRTFTTASAE